jgi:hypothetical protein
MKTLQDPEAAETVQTEEIPAVAPAATCSGIVGHWTPVAEKMPDDEITVLVWVSTLDDATLAYHCSGVLEKRGDSGWILAGHARAERVLLGVTHWCADICPPNRELSQPPSVDNS